MNSDRIDEIAPSRYLHFTREEWARLRDSTPLTLSESDLERLRGLNEPVSVQDLRIIDLVLESGRALVLAYNKWDLLDDERRIYLEKEIEQDLSHVSWAPRVNISARTGRFLIYFARSPVRRAPDGLEPPERVLP